ncbi:MAG: TRAP transporter large permease [Candidatus Dormibacteria bacterium]
MTVALLVMVAIIIFCYLTGAPLGYGLIAGGCAYLIVAGVSLTQAAGVIVGGVTANFVILAVPLFIFTSSLLNSSGMTDRIFRFAQLLLGRSPGALAQVNVIATIVFSGMTGSAVADVSGIGVMSVRAMEAAGYPKGFACATTTTSAIMGPLLPPSIPLVIYGFLSQTSIGALFLAGIIPAAVLALAHMGLIGYLARRKHLPKEKWLGWFPIAVAFLSGLPALLAPMILIGGIYSGVFTPTESSAISVLYAVVVSVVVYRSLSFAQFRRCLGHAVRQTGAVTGLIVGAFLIDYAVTSSELPATIAQFVLSLTHQPTLLLLLVCAMLLVAGLVLEVIVLEFVMLPIIVPIMHAASVNMVFFGVVFTLVTMIALGMPTLGLLNFILSKLTDTPLTEIIREMWPFLGLLVVGLVVVLLFPQMSLFLPHLAGVGGG